MTKLEQLKLLVLNLEERDFAKALAGAPRPGVRVRKQLKEVVWLCSTIRHETLKKPE